MTMMLKKLMLDAVKMAKQVQELQREAKSYTFKVMLTHSIVF